MKNLLSLLIAAVAAQFAFSQNVGIGTSSPTLSKLQLESSNTQLIASSGPNTPGLSFSTGFLNGYPALGFNLYFSGTYHFMDNGYGKMFQYQPSTGVLYLSSTTNKGTAGQTGFFTSNIAIDSNGYMGLGTSIPKAPLHVTGNVVFGSSSILPATGYKVSIDGKVICEELKVQVSTSWPDYVFEDEYNLPSLESIEAKTMAEKHLPGIPSAADVKAQQGIELGDMQKRMLEKMEEMYRYMFQINKENKEIKKDNKTLKDEVAALRKQLQPILQ